MGPADAPLLFLEQRIIIGRKLKRGRDVFEAARVEAAGAGDVQRQG